jgi:5'-3' exonuclease
VLLLIDYSSLLYRAYHSLPDSLPARGVHGFLNMLARLVTDHGPRELAICVDDDWRPAFRTDALPSYKAHRVAAEGDEVDEAIADDETLGREVLDAMGFAVVGAEGFEGEDVIATLADGAAEPVAIVSGDRDCFALVRDPDVVVLYPVKGVSTLARIDEAEITRRYGIPGRAYIDFALLRGDPSDGLPGVRGIGEKTAAALVRRYGSLDGILAARDLEGAVARRLADAREYLAAARRVVPPVHTLELPRRSLALPHEPSDPRRLAALAAEHRLDGPIERVRAAVGHGAGSG